MNAPDPTSPAQNLDRDQVIHVLGPIDDDTILRIIATGASKAQLLEARERLARPGEVAKEMQHTPTGVVGDIIEIVESAEPQWNDAHDRD